MQAKTIFLIVVLSPLAIGIIALLIEFYVASIDEKLLANYMQDKPYSLDTFDEKTRRRLLHALTALGLARKFLKHAWLTLFGIIAILGILFAFRQIL
jgi:hypothetical protein